MTAVLRLRASPFTVPTLLVAATILAQITYPLTSGVGRGRMTTVVVLVGAAAAVAHAGLAAGRRGLTAVAGVGVTGLLAEAVGVHTGVPFGTYSYAGDLGVEVAGVPLLVVAAWISMAWPAAVVARRVADGFAARVAVGAWALAAWDVFLDPQMVTAGHWSWAPGGLRLPGVPDVPVSNFLGWLFVSALISLLVQAFLGRRPWRATPTPMLVLYVWTAASSTLAAAVFWHRPAVAGWGLLAMGPVALAVLRARRPAAR